MKAIKLFIAVIFLFAMSVHAQDSLVLRKIYDEALVNGIISEFKVSV
jgi:hypothetical protein